MNTKNRLIESLLKVAKKHKILTYPVLALVAIISVVDYFFSWSTGAGKRVIAIVMVMVMLVSQSYFLTSSATELVDDDQAALVQMELQEEVIIDTPEDIEESAVDSEPAETVEESSIETVAEVSTEESTSVVASSDETDSYLAEEVIEEEDIYTEIEDDSNASSVFSEGNTDEAEELIDEDIDTKLADEESTVTILFRYTTKDGVSSNLSPVTVSADASLVRAAFVAASATLNEEGYTENCYQYSNEWYYDEACTNEVTDFQKIAEMESSTKNPIQLFCKRVLVRYAVSVIDYADGSESVGSFTAEGNSYDADGTIVYVDAQNGNAVLELSNLKRKGYDFSKADDTGATGGDSVSILINGDNYSRTVQLYWTPKVYQVQYSKNEEGTEYVNQTVTYDNSNYYVLDNKESSDTGTLQVSKKTGFTFKTWKIQGADLEVAPGTQIKSIQQYTDFDSDRPIVLVPVYDYDEIMLTEYAINDYEYDQPGATHTIRAYYETAERPYDDDPLGYEIVTPEETLNEWANKYGITVKKTNGIEIGTAGPKAVPASPLELTIQVIDHSGTEDRTAERTVTISIKRCPISIVPATDQSNTKVYDGTTEVNASFSNELATDTEGVTVVFDKCEYEFANAGTPSIILEGPSISVPEGKDPSGYELLPNDGYGFSVAGKINQRKVYLKTYSDRPTIEIGEPTPVDSFHLDVDDTVELGNDEGFVEGESVGDLGEVTFSVFPDRTDLKLETSYRIQVSVGTDSNYQVIVNSSSEGVFEVIKMMPIRDTNYRIAGSYNESSGWYIGGPAQISPIQSAGYDTVHVSKDRSDYLSGTEAAPVNINDDKDGQYYIRLYNSITKAETGWEPITVKVDESAPVYESFTISAGGTELTDGQEISGGLYFPGVGRKLTFGNYFNKTITVTVTYKDEVSGLSTLHYSIYGGEEKQTFFVRKEDGTATANFEIAAGVENERGEISFWADDIAGNNEVSPNKLSSDGVTEWSVEEKEPAIKSFSVLAGEYHAVKVENGSDTYYRNCLAVLEVADLVSGIYDVTWNVNGEIINERVSVENSRQTEYIFEKAINIANFPSAARADGKYVVYATVSDNADNTITTDTIEFYVDDEPPVLNIAENYDKTWQDIARLEFNTYDLLSDIKYINVTDSAGNLIEHRVEYVDESGDERISYCYFEVTQKGTYYVIVSDNAGNIAKEQIVFTKVSGLVPNCPEVTIDPANPNGNNGWYTSIPSFRIQGDANTEGEAPVSTFYQIWKEGEVDMTPANIGETSISADFPGNGIYHLKTWSETAANMKCKNADDHEYEIKIDTIDPVITFETSKGTGSTVLVHFVVSDTESGIDSSRIMVLHGSADVPVKVEETSNGYEGSFEISEIGNYTIQAADIAGNVAESVSFTPMSMKVRPVTNITDDSVTLGATVLKGTFDITNATISYRKYEDTEYTDVTDAFVSVDNGGNWTVSTILENLEVGNVYSYRITATSSADEVLEYDGLFKTLTFNAGTSVTGTARYANDVDGTITVALYDGSVCTMAMEVKAGDEFTFKNVQDGNYNIVATDGVYSKSMRVLIEDGLIVYPENYIELVLSGKNTSVVLTTANTPHVTADNMDSIFEDDVTNFNSTDNALLMNGGTVEFKLYATLIPVSNVSSKEIAAMYAVTEQNKVVGAYLDLSLYKISSDANGEVIEKKRVTELASGANISVTIPLGDLAGKSGLEVVRIHDTGDRYVGASLVDQDTNPNTYTVTTNQFSTYAVLYSLNAASTETPKTTQEVILEGTAEPSSSGTIYTTPTDNGKTDPPSDDSGDDNIDNSSKKNQKKANNIKKPSSNRQASVGSLRSSGSAKTGDETPIFVMVVVMIISAGCMMFLRRKKNEK